MSISDYSFEGIVIKRQNLGETDKLITIFTPEFGKITLVARGIRRLNSKRAGSLELFNVIKARAVVGKGSLDILTDVNNIRTSYPWRNQLGKITLGYQLCEVVDRLTPEKQPFPQTYRILNSGLVEISRLGKGWESRFNEWLVEIVCDLGYWPKNQEFKQDIRKFIENISEHPLFSPQLLKKLSR